MLYRFTKVPLKTILVSLETSISFLRSLDVTCIMLIETLIEKDNFLTRKMKISHVSFFRQFVNDLNQKSHFFDGESFEITSTVLLMLNVHICCTSYGLRGEYGIG